MYTMMDINPIINCVLTAVCLHHPNLFCPVGLCGAVWGCGEDSRFKNYTHPGENPTEK